MLRTTLVARHLCARRSFIIVRHISKQPANAPRLLTRSPPPPPAAPPLTEIKQTTKLDIQDAVAHGILTPPPEGASFFRKLLHQAIQLTKFYYRGVKLIWTRQSEVRRIKARIAQGGKPITWQEMHLLRTQSSDVSKVIPFVFIALLLEEVIPLIAIFAPSMLPSTCILPSQRTRIDEKKNAMALALAWSNRSLFAKLTTEHASHGHLSLNVLRAAGALTPVCGIMRLSTLGFDALRGRRLHKHLDFITEDDRLLVKEQPTLSDEQLNSALSERGLLHPEKSLIAKRACLDWWLSSATSSENDPISRRIFLLASAYSTPISINKLHGDKS